MSASVSSVDNGVQLLAASPNLCYTTVPVPPRLLNAQDSSNQALATSRAVAKERGYAVHSAAGGIAVISRRANDMDVEAWRQVMQVLLCTGGQWVSTDVMVREAMLDAWKSFSAPYASWLIIEVQPRPREVAPKYGVYDICLKPRPDCPHGGRLQWLMNESFAQHVSDSARRVATCQVTSASISLRAFESEVRANVAVIVQAHVYVMHNVIAAFEAAAVAGEGGEEAPLLILRPSLKIVLDYFSKEFEQHAVATSVSTAITTRAGEDGPAKGDGEDGRGTGDGEGRAEGVVDPIFAEIGSQPMHALSAVAEQHSFCKKRLSFVGLKPLVGTQEQLAPSSRTVALLFPTPEGQPPLPEVVDVERRYTVVWRLAPDAMKRPRSQLGEAQSREAIDEEVLASLSVLRRNSGLAYLTTAIRAERFADVEAIVRRRSSDDVDVHIVGNVVELRKHEPSMWKKLRIEMDALASRSTSLAATLIIETLAAQKEHNDLRSKVLQRVKILNLGCEQRVRALPDGRSAHRLCIKCHQLPEVRSMQLPSVTIGAPAVAAPPVFLTPPSAYPAPPSAYAAQPSASPAPPSAYAAQPSASPAPPSAYAAQPSASPAPPSAYAAQPSASPAPPSAYAAQPSAYPAQPSASSAQPSAYPASPGYPSAWPQRSEPLPTPRLDAPYNPAVLYEQIAPFQRRLPAGWESRHVNDAVGRMNVRDVAARFAPSPTVFLDHVAKKAYCGEPFTGTPQGGIEAFLEGNLQHLTQLHERILTQRLASL